MRPQVSIQIAEDVPLKENTKTYHSIRVANNGRTLAKNCTALLTIKNLAEDDIVNSQKAFLNKRSYRPIKDEPLCWAWVTHDPVGTLTNPSRLSIYPNSAQLLDIYAVTSGNFNVWIPSEVGWDHLRVILRSRKEKDYEIELKIHAENVTYDRRKHAQSFKLIRDEEKNDVQLLPVDKVGIKE